jgi:hypothetical protein
MRWTEEKRFWHGVFFESIYTYRVIAPIFTLATPKNRPHTPEEAWLDILMYMWKYYIHCNELFVPILIKRELSLQWGWSELFTNRYFRDLVKKDQLLYVHRPGLKSGFKLSIQEANKFNLLIISKS